MKAWKKKEAAVVIKYITNKFFRVNNVKFFSKILFIFTNAIKN